MSDKNKTPSYLKTGIILYLGIFFIVLLSTGCTGVFSGVQNATAVQPATITRPSPEDCSFDRQTDKLESRFPALDACYFRTHTAIQYLNDLRRHHYEPVTVMNAPGDWITFRDAELLMKMIDSTEPAAPVVSPISSYRPFNETSTVGNEALFLLEGYRTGRYPPGLSSLYYFKPNRTEVRAWWETNGRHGFPDEQDAIRIVQGTHPDLLKYPSEKFPTKSIKTEKDPDGWYVAFIIEGSGVPIVSARCYYVGNDRVVRPTGLVNHSIMVLPEDFSAQMCG